MPENDLQYYIASPFFAGLGEEAAASRDSFLSRFDTLSQNQKDLLVSTKTAERIARITSDTRLDDEQTEFVALVIREVLTGLASASDIAGLLSEHLRIAPDVAAHIAGRVWNEVMNASSTATQPERLVPDQSRTTAPRRLNQLSPSQEEGTNHIINLRDSE